MRDMERGDCMGLRECFDMCLNVNELRLEGVSAC